MDTKVKKFTAVIFIGLAFLFCSCNKPTAREQQMAKEMEKRLETVHPGDILVTKNGQILVVTQNVGKSTRYVPFGQYSSLMDNYLLAPRLQTIIRTNELGYEGLVMSYIRQPS